MILSSIRVEGWRCFADPIEIAFDARLNVLHAPNGSGKSKLLEALQRGCFDSHRVTGRDVDALRPWGRNLAPCVAIDFTCGETAYRLEKRFLDDPSAILRRREDGRLVPLAEGDAADDRVRELLLGSAPGRGISKSSHWGLAQILWAPQDGLALGELSENVVSDIRGSLGKQVTSRSASAIEHRVSELYLAIFTPTGRVRGGAGAPRVAALEEKLKDLQNQSRSRHERLQAFESASRDVQDLAAQRAQRERDLDALRSAVAEVRVRAGAYIELEAKRTTLSAQLAAIEVRCEEMTRRIDRIAAARAESMQAEARLHAHRAEEPALRALLESVQTAQADAVAEVERVRAAREDVEKARGLLDAARRVTTLREACERDEKLLAKAEKEAGQLERHRAQWAKLVAPDAKELRAIQKSFQERATLRAQLDSAMVTLEITPVRAAILEVRQGETPGPQPAAAGERTIVRGSPVVEIEIPKLGKIRASGPAEGVADLREKLARVERVLAERVAPYGTQDPDELERLAERRRELDDRIRKAAERLETLLEETSLDERRQGLARRQLELRESLKEHRAWQSQPPDVAALEAAEAEQRKRQRADEKQAEARLETAQTTLRTVDRRWRDLQGDLLEAEREIARLRAELEELQDDDLSDAERRAGWAKARRERDEMQAALDEASVALEAHPDDPRRELDRMERQFAAADADSRSLFDKERAAFGRLEQLSVEAPYSALAQAEEELARVEEEYGLEKLRADAIALLHGTVEELRTEAVAAVAGPVEERATRTLQRIAGGRLGRIALTDRFEPRHVEPEQLSAAVGLGELSGGEREQLHLAVRLALAEVLAERERQLVVLDDVLTATDTPRLARIQAIFDEAAACLQILILTCHPERYRGLTAARFIDLREVTGKS